MEVDLWACVRCSMIDVLALVRPSTFKCSTVMLMTSCDACRDCVTSCHGMKKHQVIFSVPCAIIMLNFMNVEDSDKITAAKRVHSYMCKWLPEQISQPICLYP